MKIAIGDEMDEQQRLITVTIEPVARLDGGSGHQYQVMVDTMNANPWVRHGRCDSADEVLSAFTMPLSTSYQSAILVAIDKGESISFKLADAYRST